ncbi:unnamed protein product [Oncorhynchus mykiss]|uniref:Coilin N-terminal domain-containing protein n=1 Tax=Oncorhynchus mykiss TaxID=8022 RepID=A0A060YST3_ONCMY|nr:unnamed protein product [Oncorhynchus mykiss]
MAASNTNVIRVRLYFDYPPPSVSDCRMCWVLVDLNKCRVVADIASVIREKFDFSRRSILSLFIEDCYLPHTESIYVVRDNDSIRVKVDTLTLSSGSQPNTSAVKSKKRRRAAEEEEEPTQNRVSEEWKKKKKRKESQEADSNQAAVEERRKEDKKKQKKQKKKDKVSTKTTASSTGPPPPLDKNTKKAPAATAVSVNGKATAKSPNWETDDSSDSSESSSEEEEAPSKTPMQKLPPKSHSASSTPPVTSKATPVVKPRVPIKKPRPPPSSSDSDSSDSSGDDASSKATTAKPPSPCSSSSSEEEIQLVIKQPGLGMGIVPAMAAQPTWRGRGSPRGWDRGPRGGKGGRGEDAGFYFNYEGGQRQQTPQPPSYQKDFLNNSSVVFQNPSESVPKRDYSKMPLLAAPPQDGQKIAFKVTHLL